MIGKLLEKYTPGSDKDAEPQSRRNFLVGGATAAMTAVGAAASAQVRVKGGGTITHVGPRVNPGGTVGGGIIGVPISQIDHASRDPFAQYWSNASLRLARRISYGVTFEELDELKSKSFDEYLDEQLDWESIDDNEVESALRTMNSKIGMSMTDLARADVRWTDLMVPYMYNAAFSKRQLKARLVEFWMDHFYINERSANTDRTIDYIYNRIEPLAFTTFRQLLEASAKSAAMSKYLNNELNKVNRPNINYARELLELHTVSTTGGYTEEDIEEVAKILTGWTIEWDQSRDDYAQCIFRPHWHESGPKTVMGRVFQENGPHELDELLDFLCDLRATHDYLCQKMFHFFIGRDPRQDEYDGFHAAWTQSGGDVETLLRRVLTEDNVVTAPSLYKRPYHFYIGYFRQFNLRSANIAQLLYRYLRESGQVPFAWNDPDGYPQEGDFWINGHVTRLQHSMKIGAQNDGAMLYDMEEILPDRSSISAIVDRLDEVMFGGEMSTPEKIWISRYMRGKKLTDVIMNRGVIAVALGSPTYQWY